jgi:hypothetical protein
MAAHFPNTYTWPLTSLTHIHGRSLGADTSKGGVKLVLRLKPPFLVKLLDKSNVQEVDFRM